jgi:hypothetical protein
MISAQLPSGEVEPEMEASAGPLGDRRRLPLPASVDENQDPNARIKAEPGETVSSVFVAPREGNEEEDQEDVSSIRAVERRIVPPAASNREEAGTTSDDDDGVEDNGDSSTPVTAVMTETPSSLTAAKSSLSFAAVQVRIEPAGSSGETSSTCSSDTSVAVDGSGECWTVLKTS